MSYSAETFNRWVRAVRQFWPVQGQGCELFYTSDGIIITGDAEQLWQHPWQVRCQTAPKEDSKTEEVEWRAFLKPGFVNGRDATIEQRREDPKTRKPVTLQVPLTDEVRPWLVLDGWRNPLAPQSVSAGLDGEIRVGAAEGYPKYFEKIGVKAAPKGGKINEPGALEAEAEETRTREIRAMDIVLVVPRIATRSDVTLRDPATDGQTVVITTAFVNDYARSAPAPFRLLAKAKWEPPREPDQLERMMGTAVEPQTDELKLSTVWIVSPPDTSADAVPNATWTPYPQHFVFWNLNHASRKQPGKQPDKPLELRTGLVGGIADGLFQALLSPVNDAFAKIDAFFSGADFKGEFWN